MMKQCDIGEQAEKAERDWMLLQCPVHAEPFAVVTPVPHWEPCIASAVLGASQPPHASPAEGLES